MPSRNTKELFVQATAHHQAGRIAEAEQSYKALVSLQPRNGDALHLLGLLLINRGDFADAVDFLKRAVAERPMDGVFRCDLALTLESLGMIDDAIAEYRRAIALKPDLAAAHTNLGSGLLAKGLIEESLAVLENAIRRFPPTAQLCNNLGNTYRDLGRIDQAIALYRQSCALMPAAPKPRWNLSIALLLKGNFSEGWAGYEARQAAENAPTVVNLDVPTWDGSNLAGRTILLYTNQGIGDVIQCVRYLPILAAQGGRIVLGLAGTQPALRRLLAGQCGISQIVVEGEKFPPAHVQFLLDRLPAAFGASPQTLPGPIPYLRPDANLANVWRQRLADERRLKVGLAWSGNPRHPRDHFRSIPPELLAPLAEVPGIRWISLQKDNPGSAMRQPSEKFQLTDWTAELTDFADTAALAANLDLVISVDTSVAHLAGAIGKPVWVPLQFSPDWRWMLNRPDSPWYPTMRLFRQKKLRDWNGPITQLAQELSARSVQRA